MTLLANRKLDIDGKINLDDFLEGVSDLSQMMGQIQIFLSEHW
jgi:hypothetical protein